VLCVNPFIVTQTAGGKKDEWADPLQQRADKEGIKRVLESKAKNTGVY